MITIDSNAPYATDFPLKTAGEAVYMQAEDPFYGKVLAVVYKTSTATPRLSVILIGAHGTSGYVDMTLSESSRFFGACKGLANAHFNSQVRRALAIAALRTYATMDRPLRSELMNRAQPRMGNLRTYDESAAGALGSQFHLVYGKFPSEIGARIIQSGLIAAKQIKTSIVDIVYEDSDLTIEQNNELVYLLGNQLEHLFDPLNEYSPEPTENLYVPPQSPTSSLDDEPQLVQDICEELYLLQSRVRGDLVDFLQSFLIPLRVAVLQGDLEGVTIEKLNRAFPPTIDELFRVNNLLYDALRAALPLGAYEVLRACGTTVPYFYRACMRHEAATRGFAADLDALGPLVKEMAAEYSMQRIQSVIQNSLHLVKLKLVLDRLTSSKEWPEDQKATIEEYHRVAVGTIDAFGREKNNESYNGRVFTPSGKLLVEIASGWPAELEYGWLTRRVVSIFDAVDTLEVDDRYQQLHDVVILFTDAVVICKPTEPIPTKSLSGLHIPAIGDMLMHAMLNEVPLDKNIPPLKVTAWASILDVTFASIGQKSLFMCTQPEPFKPDGGFARIYSLVQPDHDADRFVELLAKSKMTTKTQQFHLFKLDGPDLTLYSTVQEVAGYKEEVNRNGVAVFLSSNVDASTLDEYDLTAAVSLRFSEQQKDVVDVQILSKLGYNSSTSVKRDNVRQFVTSEVSYLVTLLHSSQNPRGLNAIVEGNKDIASKLIGWASSPSSIPRARGHRRSIPAPVRPNTFTVPRKSKENLRPALAQKSTLVKEPSSLRSSLRFDAPTAPLQFKKSESKLSKLSKQSIPEPSSSYSEISKDLAPSVVAPSVVAPSVAAPSDPQPIVPNVPLDMPPLRRKESFQKPRSASDTAATATQERPLSAQPSMDTELFYSSHSFSSLAMQSSRQSTLGMQSSFGAQSTRSLPLTKGKDDASAVWDDDDADAAEQRDVDAWYSQLHQRDAQSLSSAMSDVSFSHSDSQSGTNVDSGTASGSTSGSVSGSGSAEESENDGISRGSSSASNNLLRNNSTASESIQIGAFLSRSTSQLYNQSAGRIFAPIVNSETHESMASLQSDRGTSSEEQDFSYLAQLVRSGSDASSLGGDVQGRNVYPDLRDTSVAQLGHFILRNDRSDWSIAAGKAPIDRSVPKIDSSKQFLGPNDRTPTLDSVRAETSAWGFPHVQNDLVFDDEDPESNWLAYMKNETDTNLKLSHRSLASRVSRMSIASKAARMSDDSIMKTPRMGLHESKSMASFKRMVMASSLNTLQMASFTVQLEQRARSAPIAVSRDMEFMKQTLTAIFNDKHPSVELEVVRRRQLMAMAWTLISLGQDQLLEGLLEVEWIRRNRVGDNISEQDGQEAITILWTVQ